MKKALGMGAGAVAVIVAALVVVPPFIDLGSHKGRFLPLIEEALGRRVDVGEVRLRILPTPAIHISSLTVGDNPAFSQEPFFTAQGIRLQLKFWPLLRGELRVKDFILEKPAVKLLKRPDGVFNFADIAKKKGPAGKREATPKSPGPSEFSELIPALLRIEEGEVTLQTKGQRPLTIRGINVTLEDFSADRPFPYRLSLTPSGFKSVTLAGRLIYDASQATLRLAENHLNAADTDFAMNGAVADLSGVPKLNLTLANEAFETKPILQLLAAAALVPKGLEASGPMGLRVALTGPASSLTSVVTAHVNELKVRDSRAFDGTLGGDVLLSLPLGGDAPLARTLSGNGKLVAKDGQLTNVDLISKIQLLTGLVGLSKGQSSGATTFKTLETEFGLGGGTAEVRRLSLTNPVMEAAGSGRISLPSPSLDFAIEVALAPEVSARAGSGRAATFFKDSRGRIVVPLKITGPIREPSVSLDSSKLVKKGIGQLFERFFKGR